MTTPTINEEDQAVLNAMTEGDSIDKEAADVAVARMLQEQAALEATEEDADGTEADGEGGAEGGAEKKPPTEREESDSQRRRRMRREAETRVRMERDQAIAQNRRLVERVKALEQRIPSPDDYGDDHAAYIADRAALSAQHAVLTNEAEESERLARAKEEEIAGFEKESRAAFFSEGDRTYKDFTATIQNPELPITPAMGELFLSGGMADIAYHLAKNPAEMARIARLPNPIEQVKEIISAQAALKAKAAQERVSKAPPPVKPVRAVGASPQKDPSQMSMAEYAKWRRETGSR